MYGYIEYLILKIEEGCTCDTRGLAQVPELLGGGFRRAYGSRKILGNVFSRPIPLYFLHFWVCLAARKLTCFRLFGQKDAHEHADDFPSRHGSPTVSKRGPDGDLKASTSGALGAGVPGAPGFYPSLE